MVWIWAQTFINSVVAVSLTWMSDIYASMGGVWSTLLVLFFLLFLVSAFITPLRSAIISEVASDSARNINAGKFSKPARDASKRGRYGRGRS